MKRYTGVVLGFCLVVCVWGMTRSYFRVRDEWKEKADSYRFELVYTYGFHEGWIDGAGTLPPFKGIEIRARRWHTLRYLKNATKDPQFNKWFRGYARGFKSARYRQDQFFMLPRPVLTGNFDSETTGFLWPFKETVDE